jgi:hypothetical protein
MPGVESWLGTVVPSQDVGLPYAEGVRVFPAQNHRPASTRVYAKLPYNGSLIRLTGPETAQKGQETLEVDLSGKLPYSGC